MKQKHVKNRARGCCILIGLFAINSAYSMDGSLPLYNYISGKFCGAESSQRIAAMKTPCGACIFDDIDLSILENGRMFVKLRELDYQKAVSEAEGGDLKHLSPLWSIYEGYKDSASYFEKTVGAVSAFLAAVCASNEYKLNLKEIDNGMDVYKCLLNLGFKNIQNPVKTDQDSMTFEKLMRSLPKFMKSLGQKGMLDKLTGKEKRVEDGSGSDSEDEDARYSSEEEDKGKIATVTKEVEELKRLVAEKEAAERQKKKSAGKKSSRSAAALKRQLNGADSSKTTPVKRVEDGSESDSDDEMYSSEEEDLAAIAAAEKRVKELEEKLAEKEKSERQKRKSVEKKQRSKADLEKRLNGAPKPGTTKTAVKKVNKKKWGK